MTIVLAPKTDGCGDCRPAAGCLYCARLTPVLAKLEEPVPEAVAVPDDVLEAALALFAGGAHRDREGHGGKPQRH